MATFYESENSPIASELVRQGFTLDRGEVLRIVDIDEKASGTDTAIAIGTAAISLVAACGTLALSGFTLPILAPIAALSYAGLTAWNSRATKQEREFEAEFLHHHPEFVEAVNQKLEAGEESDRVAAAYEQTFKAFITGDRQRLHSFFPVAVVPLQMAPYPQELDSGPTVATSSPIGTATKFGAVEVPASPAAEASAQNETMALSALLRSPFLSRALFGAQRTGKSYLAAVASAEMTKTGVNIFHMNLMSYGSEDAEYWQHAKKSIRCDLPALSVSDGKPFIKQAIALVAEFVQTPNSLLIVDEWAYIASTANPHRESLVGLLNDISSQITSLSSAGIKRQRGLWAISPEFVAGSLVPQGKAVKKLQLVYVTIHPDRLVDWNGNAIGFSDELFQQVANNFPIELPNSMELPECDRIVYIDRQWLPVGELPGLEDSKPLKQAIKLNDRQQLEAAFKASTPDQEAPIEEAKSNISKPNLPAKDLMLAIAMLAEWIEQNPDVEPEKIYEKYNARRKGFSRPEIRFLLTQIDNLSDP